MTNEFTWPMVWMAGIAAAPGIIAALAALGARRLGQENQNTLKVATAVGEENKAAVEKVHTLVNSQNAEIQKKLDASREETAGLKEEILRLSKLSSLREGQQQGARDEQIRTSIPGIVGAAPAQAGPPALAGGTVTDPVHIEIDKVKDPPA